MDNAVTVLKQDERSPGMTSAVIKFIAAIGPDIELTITPLANDPSYPALLR